MNLRHYADPRTQLPYIYDHDVSELEVAQVLEQSAEDCRGSDGSRFAIGSTSTDRTLRVVYASGPEPSSVFVITAYDLCGKPLLAHRRRMRRISK